MTDLNYMLERTIVICAEKKTVFRFFTDSKLWADWWGSGSEIEARPGGVMRIRYPNGVIASGEVVEVQQQERIVFTYGYESGKPIPPGASKVTITLREHREGTELTLKQHFADEGVRDSHVFGWRYQLALFANVAAREQHSRLEELLDEYFTLWKVTDADQRREVLNRIVTPEVVFQDAYGCTSGSDELNWHIGAVQQHMAGLSLERHGTSEQCQGNAYCNWIAINKDGSRNASGVNLFSLTPDTRIKHIVGFWRR